MTDTRVICIDCASYRLGYCTTADQAGLSRQPRLEIGYDLAHLKQNCPAFQSARRTRA
jgi:hypothetical protein